MAPYLQMPAARNGWREFWSLYGLADYRYLHADPFVRALELVTGTLVAALNLWTAYVVWRRRRQAVAIVVLLTASIMEVYGTILYFGSEWLNHWANVDTSSFLHAWVMFFGLNVLWLLIPGWCIYEILRVVLAARVGAAQPAAAPVPSSAIRNFAEPEPAP